MVTENNTDNIKGLDVTEYDEFIGKLSDADLKELANKICEILQNNPDYSSLEDNNTAGTKTKRDRVLEGTQEILNSMLRVANVAHKAGLEEDLRYKVPALRFGDLKDLPFEEKRDEILDYGMVLSCEPGIYIPEENIGIRIETVMLVNDTPIDLMPNLPLTVEEIELLMNKK